MTPKWMRIQQPFLAIFCVVYGLNYSMTPRARSDEKIITSRIQPRSQTTPGFNDSRVDENTETHFVLFLCLSWDFDSMTPRRTRRLQRKCVSPYVIWLMDSVTPEWTRRLQLIFPSPHQLYGRGFNNSRMNEKTATILTRLYLIQ